MSIHKKVSQPIKLAVIGLILIVGIVIALTAINQSTYNRPAARMFDSGH